MRFSSRTFLCFLILGMLIITLAFGCKTAPDSISGVGYVFIVKTGDMLDAIAKAYRGQVVDVGRERVECYGV
jgi:hypothetical protein